MWEKPEQLTATGIARPMRVAYLVNIHDCPVPLLDAIVAECYGRWGGRRTLIVPATARGVEAQYDDWLFYFDADVVYSFVALSDAAIAEFHERYAPAYLVKHHEGIAANRDQPRYFIDLPLHGLSSLSVLPTFARTARNFDGPPPNVMLLDKYWDRSASQFTKENFGFLSSTFSTSAVATAYPDVFSCMTLISEQALSDPRVVKDKRARFVTSEDQVLDSLSSTNGPLTLTQLAEFYTPYLETGDMAPDGTTLVAGNSVLDWLLFWNIHHHYTRGGPSQITSLRLPADRLDDEAFIRRVRQIIERRGVRGHDGRTDRAILCSTSLDNEQLSSLAERLRKSGNWLAVDVKGLLDHTSIVPSFKDPERVYYRRGGVFGEPACKATSEYTGKRFAVPMAAPWHIREAPPPTNLRQGCWMIDLTAERHIDHSRYINQRQPWTLPRRLRFERMFTVEREGERDHDYRGRFIRPMRSGAMGIALSAYVTRAAVTAPDDLEAFLGALCNDNEWMPFDRFEEKSPRAQPRFAYAALSDKGRYLLGVLALFETVPDAFEVLMNGYWRDVLRGLGALPAEKDEVAKARVLRVLRKRLGRQQGPLTFESDAQLDRLGREALRAGRMLAREQRLIPYDELYKQWKKLVDEFIEDHPRPDGQLDDRDVREVLRLDRSIQYLCARELIFQGREWQCQTCYNRNWVPLDAMQRRLTCTVCRRDEPAPVTGEWHFRANPFVIEAYRDHGCEAVVWALWRLFDRARQSFYFTPSVKLWLKYPENRGDRWDAEIDAVAVVDGRVFAVEAKSSSGIDGGEMAHLALAAKHIRPDVLLIASMEPASDKSRRAIASLRSCLPSCTEIETLHFNDAALDRRPWLPA